jgi:hypothetical protein
MASALGEVTYQIFYRVKLHLTLEIYLIIFCFVFLSEALFSLPFTDNYNYSNMNVHRKGHSFIEFMFNEPKNSIQLCGMLYVSDYEAVGHVCSNKNDRPANMERSAENIPFSRINYYCNGHCMCNQ